jgi:hypothetical protein
LPANGVDDDVLQAFRLENDGTASAADIEAVQLLADDGDHRVGAADVLVAQLQPKSGRVWDATGLDWPLVATAPRRYLVAIDGSPSPSKSPSAPGFRSGAHGRERQHGPIDRELSSNPIFSVPGSITWIAGIANDHVVRPDAERQS